jgi:hypothetical protein
MMQSCASAAKLRGGGPILETGVLAPWPASGDRHLGSSSDTKRCPFSSGSERLSYLSAYLTPLATQRQSEPRQWSLGAIGQLAVLDPTDELGWETERCQMAQATAAILDSTAT